MNIIEVKNLTKQFTFPVKSENKGFWKSMFSSEKKTVDAVKDVSFSVKAGETIAFIGPNGAGKSTTIKMMTGILTPTVGNISVCGHNPQEDRKKLAFKIGTVFGQRSQLIQNLPFIESFKLFGKIYEMTDAQIEKRQKELFEQFDLEDIKNQPVRKLSLGQRMRAEVAVSLIHNPQILFLDEPTIGLDVIAKKKFREALLALNKEQNTTIFLTSHDAGDIEALCKRTVVVNHGKIVIDMDTAELARTYLTYKIIRVVLKDETPFVLPDADEVVKTEIGYECKIDTRKHPLSEVVKHIVTKYDVEDIDVSNPLLEESIRHIYELDK